MAGMMRARICAIACGYEDCNDERRYVVPRRPEHKRPKQRGGGENRPPLPTPFQEIPE